MQSFIQRFVSDGWFGNDSKERNGSLPSRPPSIKTVTVGIHPRIISPIVQLSKRGFVSINQSLRGCCQIKYRRESKNWELCKYIFPVISRLLGSRAPPPPFSQFRPRLNGKYFLFEWKCRKRRFSAECIWLQTVTTRVLPHRIYRKHISVFSLRNLHLYSLHISC